MRFILPFFMLSLLCSCGDTVVEGGSGSGSNANGGMSVIVIDAATNLPVESAGVQLMGRDKNPIAADSNGWVAYENIPAGKDYAFHVEAAGYASILCKADIPDSLSVGKTVRLPKLGAKLQGSIAYVDMSTNAVNTQMAGSGEAKIRLKLSVPNECELLVPYRETATGLNGSYFFDSLPELANYDLSALEAKINGIVYEQFTVQNGGVLGLSGDIAIARAGVYEKAAPLNEFLLQSAPDTVAPDGKILLVFSKDVNRQRISSASFSITGANYAIETKWSDEKTLEISPVEGLWKIDDSVSIANAVELYAVDGTVIPPGNLATVLVTNGALGKISKFWLENAGTGTALSAKGDSLDLDTLLSQQKGLAFRWNKANNATSYVIYAKCADGINYASIDSGLSFASDTSAVWEYSQAFYCVEPGKPAGFFAQARNAREYQNSGIVSVAGHVRKTEE